MAHEEIVDQLTADHRRIRDLLGRLTEAGAQGREDLFRDVVEQLVAHETAEEAVVHRITRDEVDGGDELVDALLAEETDIESLLADMEDMEPTGDAFGSALHNLRDSVLGHLAHEERDEFPRLREAISENRRLQMATGYRNARDLAPTHPHPGTPHRPEVRAAVEVVEGVVDRAKDAVREAFRSD